MITVMEIFISIPTLEFLMKPNKLEVLQAHIMVLQWKLCINHIRCLLVCPQMFNHKLQILRPKHQISWMRNY